MELHQHQLIIIKKLLFDKELRFSKLNEENISSEHFTYHLKRLIELGLVEKKKNKYLLTNQGKDYAGKLDTCTLAEEKNPKVSVLVHIRRKRPDGKFEYLMNKRLKHPYFGKVGNITGKVRFGETFEEAAERELKEETGLEAKPKLKYVYHKLRFDKKHNPLQDSLFFVFLAQNPKGKVIQPQEAELFWITPENLFKRKDLFEDMKREFETRLQKRFFFLESTKEAQGY
jgi:ADP-ribose pyrophosphatase YjhB (NUDIX family)